MQTFRLNIIGDPGFDLAINLAINLDDQTRRDVIGHGHHAFPHARPADQPGSTA
ncbi:hypothetical protein HL658_34700 [Azospirillum sp. RWY-5-1]|uniref:Uncharacterized protein n=1 Tax=Azospirillum oleiclasticum TaxID=2735135 RepID=A0ABX2TM76_9PROT|nr:hypothetical protein [Azospirillum oleiclasticum]NYZ17723.1 hypothetical protein [Azospirillum oleiclasticum]NYZ24970.1 hypothetical protein [Azospirillum oleiclasticum]